MRSSEDRQRLRAKYFRLGTGEMGAAVVFFVIAIVRISPDLEGWARFAWWLTVAPLLAVLVQAGVFWLAARTWVGLRRMPAALARLYAYFGILDALLLLIGIMGIALWAPGTWGFVGFSAVWAFGVVEYVNYFVVRLAYSPRTWFDRIRGWQRPRLVEDVRSALWRRS